VWATVAPTYLSETRYTLMRQYEHCGHLTLCKWSSLDLTPIWNNTPSVLRLHLLNVHYAIALIHSDDT